LKDLGYSKIIKMHVKNRQKTLKHKWCEAHDLFKGLSGFSWNPIMNKFDAKDVRDELIKVHGG